MLPQGGQIEAGESATDPVLKKVCLEHSFSISSITDQIN
jgi:hypothetical protein